MARPAGHGTVDDAASTQSHYLLSAPKTKPQKIRLSLKAKDMRCLKEQIDP